MTEEQIAKRKRELQVQYPKMFSHPECRENEVWIGDQIVDVVFMNANIYRQNGVPSARVGSSKLLRHEVEIDGKRETPELSHCGIFVNIRELILAEEAHNEKTQQ